MIRITLLTWRLLIAYFHEDYLAQLSIANPILLALDDSVRTLSLVIMEHNQISRVGRRPVRYSNLDANARRLVSVEIYQFGPKLGAYLFFGISIAFAMVDSQISNSLLEA